MLTSVLPMDGLAQPRRIKDFEMMFRRTAISAFAITLSMGMWSLGVCGSASAGFVPPTFDKTIDSQSISDHDGFVPVCLQAAPIPELRSDRFPDSNDFNQLLDFRNLISTWYCVLSNFNRGSGDSNHSHSGGGHDSPTACLAPAAFLLSQSALDRVIDPDDFAINSITARIFRPPRLSEMFV